MFTPDFFEYFLLPVILLGTAALLIKVYRLRVLRNRHKQQVHPRYFRVFSEENIYSTTSEKKRKYMILSNRTTYVLYICLSIIGISILVALVQWLIKLTDVFFN
jgi:hypothetical protein